MNWTHVKDKTAPKEGKFLFHYHCGIGLGEWGQCYTIIHGNSERTHESYILVLFPSDVLDGNEPFQWNEEKMIEMDVKWLELPTPPEDE